MTEYRLHRAGLEGMPMRRAGETQPPARIGLLIQFQRDARGVRPDHINRDTGQLEDFFLPRFRRRD